MLERAVATAPDEKPFRFHYAIALAKSGRIDQAVPHFVTAVGSAAAHYNIGVILHDRGDLAASEDQFVTAIIENPRLEQAQVWLKKVQREREEQQFAAASDRNGFVRTAGHYASPGDENRTVESRQPRRTADAGPATGESYDSLPAGQAKGPLAPTPRSAGSQRLAQPTVTGEFAAPQSPVPVSPLARRDGAPASSGDSQPVDSWTNSQR